jgi:amino-acid N-acetyltransferase
VIRRAGQADLPAIAELVTRCGLDADGLDTAVVFVAADAAEVVGAIALEQYGLGEATAFLLRSAAVAPDARGRAVGETLVHAALRQVDSLRAPVGLLTETAGEYFTRFGFASVDRGNLPSALNDSAQLRGACPDTAQAMLRPAVTGE